MARASNLLEKEALDLDLQKGDTILTGRFKNHEEVVKDLGTDANGQPTVNGKKLLAVRIKKLMAKKAFDLASSRKLISAIRAKGLLSGRPKGMRHADWAKAQQLTEVKGPNLLPIENAARYGSNTNRIMLPSRPVAGRMLAAQPGYSTLSAEDKKLLNRIVIAHEGFEGQQVPNRPGLARRFKQLLRQTPGASLRKAMNKAYTSLKDQGARQTMLKTTGPTYYTHLSPTVLLQESNMVASLPEKHKALREFIRDVRFGEVGNLEKALPGWQYGVTRVPHKSAVRMGESLEQKIMSEELRNLPSRLYPPAPAKAPRLDQTTVLTPDERMKFLKQRLAMKKQSQAKEEYAPGLPVKGQYGDISKLPLNEIIDYVAQRHMSKQAISVKGVRVLNATFPEHITEFNNVLRKRVDTVRRLGVKVPNPEPVTSESMRNFAGKAIPGSNVAIIRRPSRNTLAHEIFHARNHLLGLSEILARGYGGYKQYKNAPMLKKVLNAGLNVHDYANSFSSPFYHKIYSDSPFRLAPLRKLVTKIPGVNSARAYVQNLKPISPEEDALIEKQLLAYRDVVSRNTPKSDK